MYVSSVSWSLYWSIRECTSHVLTRSVTMWVPYPHGAIITMLCAYCMLYNVDFVWRSLSSVMCAWLHTVY
jgi:hypothetical protein